MKNKIRIKISANHVGAFIEQLKEDSKFFQNNSIIDYSFLLGIHKKDNIPSKEFQTIRMETIKGKIIFPLENVFIKNLFF